MAYIQNEKTTGDILYPASSLSQVHELGPKVIHSGNGIYLKDIEGHEVLDAVGGLWCVNIGYGRSRNSLKSFLEHLVLMPMTP